MKYTIKSFFIGVLLTHGDGWVEDGVWAADGAVEAGLLPHELCDGEIALPDKQTKENNEDKGVKEEKELHGWGIS